MNHYTIGLSFLLGAIRIPAEVNEFTRGESTGHSQKSKIKFPSGESPAVEFPAIHKGQMSGNSPREESPAWESPAI
jgi:hypothetical protein